MCPAACISVSSSLLKPGGAANATVHYDDDMEFTKCITASIKSGVQRLSEPDITLRSAPYPKRDLQRYWNYMSQHPWRCWIAAAAAWTRVASGTRRAPSARPSWDSPHARPHALSKSMLPLIDEKSMSSMSVKHEGPYSMDDEFLEHLGIREHQFLHERRSTVVPVVVRIPLLCVSSTHSCLDTVS